MSDEASVGTDANINYMTSVPSMIPSSTMAANAKPPMPGEEYVLWGFMHDHSVTQSGQLKLMPLYRVSPSYAKTVVSPYNQSGLQQCLTAHTNSQPQAMTLSHTPNPSLLPLRSLLSSSLRPPSPPALKHTTGDSNVKKPAQNGQSPKDKRRYPERPSRPPYSPEITRCLKKAFIETIAQNQKLTKELRKQLVFETGLDSRSITYWMSNRKRRAPFLGKQYQQAVIQSCGQVKTYEDFELWGALSEN